MLTHLSIHNFAIVDDLDLEFSSGMSAITGETGAGKSIVLDALGLTLGDRADSQSVLKHNDRTDISASFDLSHSRKAISWLKENDLYSSNEVILRRTMTAEGRSRGFINGRPVPLLQLKSLGEMLIDIHSQHEHQSLLNKETHRRLVDEFGQLTKLANTTTQLYEQWKKLDRELALLKNNTEEHNARFQLLSYQVQELDALDIKQGEIEALEHEQKRLAQANTVLSNSQHVLTLCNTSDSNIGSLSIMESIQQILKLLADIPHRDKILEEINQLFISAKIHVEEAECELNHYLNEFQIDPEKLAKIEDRLSKLYNIARKHKVPPEKLYHFQIELAATLSSLQQSNTSLEKLELELDQYKQRYRDCATDLANKRRRYAKKMAAQITKQLKLLGMANICFEMAHEECAPSSHGIESLEFLISTHPGQPPRPLNKIASGGELSRISLAIQVTAAKTSKIPTLVFDEVDVGIGGATAEVVGNLLRQLGANGQVICVTHQAQVAAKAHSHLYVCKKSNKTKVQTTLTSLSEKEKVKEIARMLGGIAITEQSLAHAEQMLSSYH